MCSGCGTREDEWNEKQGGDRDAYFAESYTCEMCKRLEEKQSALESEKKAGSNLFGVKIRLITKAEQMVKNLQRRERERRKKKEK